MEEHDAGSGAAIGKVAGFGLYYNADPSTLLQTVSWPNYLPKIYFF